MSFVQIKVDERAVREHVAGMEKQFPFALSYAINLVAKDAQRAIQDSLSSKFTLRRADFVKRTIKIPRGGFARKGKPWAELGVDPERDFLAGHEAGGDKVPRGRYLAIPTEAVRRNRFDVIPRSQRPRALLASKAAGQDKVFALASGIYRVFGRGRKAVIKKLYSFKRSARIRPALGFHATATATFEATWTKHAAAAADYAIANATPPVAGDVGTDAP